MWWQRRRRSRYNIYIYRVSDLIAKQDGESFARGGVADNDVGLWAASFFFSPRFFFFVLPWKGEREREREGEKIGRKKLTIWFVRSFFVCVYRRCSSLPARSISHKKSVNEQRRIRDICLYYDLCVFISKRKMKRKKQKGEIFFFH